MKTRDAFRAQLVAGLVAGSLVLAPAAYAQTAKPKGAAPAAAASGSSPDKPLDKQQLASAKKHYGDGVTKYNSNDFAGALEDFQAADAVKQTPQTARYIGLCLDNLGRFADAVAAYNRFLANVPPKMAAQGDEIKARVGAIQLLPGKVHVTSDPTASGFSVDGKPQPNPTPAVVELAPGHHTMHFTAPGRDAADKDVEVAFATKQELNVVLPVSPPPPPAAVVVVAPPPGSTPPPPAETTTMPAPATTHSNTAAWITGGAAVVAVGVGTVFGVMALHDKSDFDSHPITATADSGENHALIADMAFGVAVTLGVTSIVLFLSRDDSPPPAAASVQPKSRDAETPKRRAAFTIVPSPIVTPHGAGAGATIRF